jgi:hypothetical protein
MVLTQDNTQCDTEHNSSQHNYTQHCDIQHDDTPHCWFVLIHSGGADAIVLTVNVLNVVAPAECHFSFLIEI